MRLPEFKEKIAPLIEGVKGLHLEDVLKVRSSFDKSKHAPGFADMNELAFWYVEQFKKQEGQCCYCESKIADIKKLLEAGKIRARKVKGEGQRGPRMEIERLDAISNEYKPSNCALACYYCNNDKSNVYEAEDYKKYLAPAKKAYIEYLIKTLQ